MANLADHLFRQARERGDRTALLFENEALCFGAIAELVRRTAGALVAAGIGIGSRVGVMMPASPDFIVVQQAVFALGATFSPLNIFYRPGELCHAIESCGLQYLVLAAEYLDRLPPPGAPGLTTLHGVIVAGAPPADPAPRLVSLDTLRAASVPIAEPVSLPQDAVAMMLSTSATTGKAKGVMLSIANVRANYDRTPGWLGLDATTVTLCALPLYNTFGLNQCINALFVTGGAMVLLPRFDAARCIAAIAAHRCTFLPVVPTMLQKIIDHPDAASHDLRSVRRIMTGGAPIPAPLVERVQATLGADTTIFTGYGLTECTALVALDRIELDAKGRVPRPKSIGRPVAGIAMRIATTDGSDAPPGEVGEIRVRGAAVMQGYYALPDETAAALVDGWLCTGDLGVEEPDGCFLIVDRKKDLIIRGGQNIYPTDIEEALYAAPGVAEAAVIAAPDDAFGEVPIAFVALRPGAVETEAALLARCREALAYYKVPAAIHFRDELPKGPTGKILRRALAVPRVEERI